MNVGIVNIGETVLRIIERLSRRRGREQKAGYNDERTQRGEELKRHRLGGMGARIYDRFEGQ
jgi:hypothetical protein